MKNVVCITGGSSGIGAALTKDLLQRGHIVHATARKLGSLAELTNQGIHALHLQVNDDESIAAAFATITQGQGHLDVLVNNTGFSQVGAVIDLSCEDLRRQYETNVIAPVAMTQAAIPLLRAAVKKAAGMLWLPISAASSACFPCLLLESIFPVKRPCTHFLMRCAWSWRPLAFMSSRFSRAAPYLISQAR